MSRQFPVLASSITLGRHKLRNRIVFGAHTANMARDGLPGEQHIAYYAERAKGGAAMIVVEPMPVHASAVLTRGNFKPSDDAVIPAFKRVTQAIKGHGAVAIQQLYHVGAHGDSDNSFHPAWSPSGLPSYHDSDGSHEMSEAEIWHLIESFVAAACRCQQAGFDGVEVWAAYLGLVDQFWTPWSNHRTDQWGGSLDNRTRFSREIMTQIRERCGPDFIIGLAISDDQDSGVMLTRQELAECVAIHDRLGLVDYVTCGSGSYLNFHPLMPTFLYPEKLGSDLAATIKATVSHALVIAESHIRTPENAETVLGEKCADLVSIVRGQIADPHLALKAMQGRAEQIRGCISCNQMCWGRRSRDYWISCLINPSAGREYIWGGDSVTPAPVSRKIVVVGAGPAGLEAARIAAERGHRVVLVEATGYLGGAFRLAGLQPRRAQILDLLGWYESELARLGVEVRLNTYCEAQDILAFAADEIVLATGAMSSETGFQKALPAVATLPGIEKGNVFTVEAVMARQARLGSHVLLLDEAGGWRGCGTAWKMAQDGHRVTIVSPDAVIARELERTAADVPLRKALKKLGVDWHVESSLLDWQGNGATLINHLSGEKTFIAADSLVLSTTNSANTQLAQELTELGQPFRAIGDCAAPRQAPYAFYEGRVTGMQL